MFVADPALELAAFSGVAFEAAPVALLVADREGRLLAVNRELEGLFGYSRTELSGASADVLMPGAAAIVRGLPRDPVESPAGHVPAAVGREIRGRRKDGSELALEIRLTPSQAATGALVVAALTETSAQHQADTRQRAAFEEQLAFERAVARLSSQFINVPTERIDEALRQGLEEACEMVQLDRAALVRMRPDGEVRDLLTWASPEVEPIQPAIVVRDRFPWTFDRVLAGDVVCFTDVEEIPDEIDRRTYTTAGTRSAAVLPLSIDGRVSAIVGFGTVRQTRAWSPEVLQQLTTIVEVFGEVIARRHRDEALQAAIEESLRLKNQLHVENVYLKTEARDRLGPAAIVGRSSALRQVLAQAEQVATTDSTVLLLGETGTGKELFASHIHSLSARHGRPMVRVNCAAIPATLIESELFGREKGAFTGALARQVGRFELADHSTIFLDEIGDLPLDVQVKLLRVLEERKFERLGSPRPISVDTRIIAATHRNLEQRVAEGSFREDLYYRLNVFPIQVPPLRDRAEDIPLLVQRLVDEFSRTFGKRIEVIERETITALQRYAWPGNIRELRNVVERAMIVTSSRRLVIPLPESTTTAAAKSPKLLDVEREHILAVLESSSWRIRGAGGAAARLGMKPTTLETRMAKLGLKRPASA